MSFMEMPFIGKLNTIADKIRSAFTSSKTLNQNIFKEPVPVVKHTCKIPTKCDCDCEDLVEQGPVEQGPVEQGPVEQGPVEEPPEELHIWGLEQSIEEPPEEKKIPIMHFEPDSPHHHW